MTDEISIIVALEDIEVLVRVNELGSVEADVRSNQSRGVWTPVSLAGGSVRVMMPNGMGSRVAERIDRDFHVIVVPERQLQVCDLCYSIHDPAAGCPHDA